jgi:signal transduction histidine kinase
MMRLPKCQFADSRQMYLVYAVFAWSAGAALCLFGPSWLGVDLPGLPFYKSALIRVAGGAIAASGFFSRAMADVDDVDARRSGLLWFIKGFLLFGAVLFTQQFAILASPEVEWGLIALLIVAFTFGHFWIEADMNPSRFDQGVREAAGREERHRLARDLHDSVKQQIFAIQTSAATAQARFSDDPAGAAAALEQVRQSAREAMSEMEAMLQQLRAAPIERAGLVSALQAQCEALGFRTGAQVRFELGEFPEDFKVAAGVPQAIYRAAQEALANVARHARATEVRVRLAVAKGWLKLTVEDNGAGFDTGQAARGMGLANMRARAEDSGGVFRLESAAGEGTKVALAVPISRPVRLMTTQRNALYMGLFLATNIVYDLERRRTSILTGCFAIVFVFFVARALWIWLGQPNRREALQ